MPTNREMLNKRGIENVLIAIEDTIYSTHYCVIDILNNSPDTPYDIKRKCIGKCDECIRNWVDEHAVLLPKKEEEK